MKKRTVESAKYVEELRSTDERFVLDKKEKAKHQRLLKTYGITLEEYKEKLDSQGGVCYICKKVYPRMNVDHMHIKGFKKLSLEEKKKYVRGILCFVCNTTIGKLERRKSGCRELLEGIRNYFLFYPIKGDLV